MPPFGGIGRRAFRTALKADREVSAGAYGRENGGMSNRTRSENLRHRKPKVSWAMSINPGLAGPKPRTKVVGDGQQVDIPAPVMVCTRRDGATKLVRTYDLSCAIR